MKPKSHPYFCIMLVMLMPACVSAQFNLNIYNGLRSNHVYSHVSDQHGYLWLATEKGVFRYNGYDLKLFDISSGLANEDVWDLFRDRKNRIWVMNISNSFGYFENAKYHKVLEKEMIYPSDIIESDSGFTIVEKMMLKDGFLPISILFSEQFSGVSEKSNPIYKNFVFGFPIKEKILVYNIENNRAIHKASLSNEIIVRHRHLVGREIQYRHYLFTYGFRGKSVEMLDLKDSIQKTFFKNTKEQQFVMMYTSRDFYNKGRYLYIIYTNKIQKLDSNLTVIREFPIESLTRPGISGNDVVNLYEDPFWGSCIGTESNGSFINFNIPDQFTRVKSWNPEKYNYIGSTNSSNGFWWNYETQTIARLNDNGAPVYTKKSLNDHAFNIIFYDENSSVLLADRLYLLTHKNGKITHFNSGKKGGEPVRPLKAAMIRKDVFYVLFSGDLHFYDFTLDSITSHSVLATRFHDMEYDAPRKTLWAYNKYKVVVVKGDQKRIISKQTLKNYGISSLEIIRIDKRFGNVFMKSNDKVLMLDENAEKPVQLLKNLNLSSAKLYLSSSHLVVAGKFGVVFRQIEGKFKLGDPVIYHNIKDLVYSIVYDLHQIGDSILLKTDAGAFKVKIPTAFNKEEHLNIPYKFLVQYQDTIFNVNERKSIRLTQGDNRLQFELIRPGGNGILKYQFIIKGAGNGWKELNANELVLPELKADEHYQLSVRVKDDVWQSNEIKLGLYVVPYWWQSSPGRQIMWFSIFLGAMLILFITVMITQRIIARNHLKRNQMLELELKSVYSQINPHFIFNTLNSALYFIKKQKLEEAQLHINRFSKLLRAYLKSSPHRYITLAEEMNNLQNYIELQQTRFEQLIKMNITTEGIDNPENVRIPSLLLQPIVENAINHGLLPKEEPGELQIMFSLNKNLKQLKCIIQDDGIGRVRSRNIKKENSPDKESYGDEMLKELVDLFKRYESMDIEIRYFDRIHPETGTIVTVTINNALFT